MTRDDEGDRFSARARRYANLGVSAGAFAARAGARRLIGGESADTARDLAQALGSLKGPLMKVAQMMATIPEALPADYAEQLISLQSQAPPMGAAFVRRRMQAELGPTGARASPNSTSRRPPPPRSARCIAPTSLAGEGSPASCSIPTWRRRWKSTSASSNSCSSSTAAWGRRSTPARSRVEIAARLREELDYEREAKLTRLYGAMLADRPRVRVPAVFEALSTRRLLTQEWLDGEPVTRFDRAEAATRNAIALGLFEAWWRPFSRFGVIHGDPHLGNYSVVVRGAGDAREVEAINLYDYGCVRIFPAALRRRRRRALSRPAREATKAASSTPTRAGASSICRARPIDALNIWARFIYGPLIDDRVRTIADGVKPGEYGRREIFAVMQALKRKGAR